MQSKVKSYIAKTFVFAQQELNSVHSVSRSVNRTGLKHNATLTTDEEVQANGFPPLRKNIPAGTELWGRSPFWIAERAKVLSALETFNSPAYLQVHYLNTELAGLLTDLLGKPDGYSEQHLLANQRTVVDYNAGEDPIFYKFSNPTLNQTQIPPQRLKEILNYNMNVGERLKDLDYVLRERNGLFFNAEANSVHYGHYQLEREIPFDQMALDGKDIFLPLFALYSPAIKRLKIAELIFPPGDKAHWFQLNIFENLMDLVLRSFFETGIHFEMHQQNISLLLREKKVSKIFVHDLFDVVEDPVAQTLLGHIRPASLQVYAQSSFGLCGGSHWHQNSSNQLSLKSIGYWYRIYLRDFGQHELAVNNVFSSEGTGISLQAAFNKLLPSYLTRFAAEFKVENIQALFEYQIVDSKSADLYARLNALRDLINIALLAKRKGSLAAENAVKDFWTKLKSKKNILTNYAFAAPETYSELTGGYNSFIINAGPDMQILLQQNILDPARHRYIAIFGND